MNDDQGTLQPGNGGLETLRTLLARTAEADETLVQLAQNAGGYLQHTNETNDHLLEITSATADQTGRQTAMAMERTALTREQTRLATRTTELANIRTELARENSSLAGQRTDLAVARTEMAHQRTSLAEDRSMLATRRTAMAAQRNQLSEVRTARARTRTRLSYQRSELARQRTYLALIRTSLAFITVGLVLFRYFGLSWWSVFDFTVIAGSMAVLYIGMKGYIKAQRRILVLESLLSKDRGFTDLLTDSY